MEYHNYNTPLDRIDEDFVKRMLAGEYESSSGCERGSGNGERENNDCGCDSRTGAAKTCRYNRRYARCSCPRSTADNAGGRCARVTDSSVYGNVGCSGANARREERPSVNGTCGNGGAEAVCGCGDCHNFTSPALHGVPYSMVYSPHQDFEGLYECEEALDRGTIFRCLDFPFVPTPCSYRRRYEENKGCR